MHNPFAKPATISQLLLTSICWVGSCLAVFFGAVYGASVLKPAHDGSAYVLGCAALICVVMWRRVIAVGWRVLGDEATSLYWGMAGLWLLLLTVLLVLSVLLIVLAVIILAD